MLLKTATQLGANPIKRGGKYTVHVTGAVGLTVTMTLGARKVTGVIDGTGDCYLVVTKPGLWTVTIMHNDDLVQTQDLLVGTQDILSLNKPFAKCTPTEIQTIARSRMASKWWHVGDEHTITLDGDETITMQIYGFDHDVGIDGTTLLPLTLGMKDCLKTKYQMNATASSASGWSGSQFYNRDIPAILARFPVEWRAIMTPCTKKTSAGGSSTVIVTSKDILITMPTAKLSAQIETKECRQAVAFPI